MTLLLDAGAFIAIENGDRDVVLLLKRELMAGREPLTHGGVIGQVWRGGHGKQANLAKLLPGVDVAALDDGLGRMAGVLLARARRADVIDAALVAIAHDGDEILTSDVDDFRVLAVASDIHVEIIPT